MGNESEPIFPTSWEESAMLSRVTQKQRSILSNPLDIQQQENECNKYWENLQDKSSLETRLKRISIYKRERLIEIMDKQNQVTRRTFSIILQYGIWITSI